MLDGEVVERTPTVEEFQSLIASVGWKEREPAAIRTALANSLYSVCVEHEGRTVAMGRIIGDGGLHYYLSDIVVAPEHQGLGLGSAVVRALGAFLAKLPHRNTLVALIAVEGSREFYERFGYRAQGPEGPAMYRWLNKGAAG